MIALGKLEVTTVRIIDADGLIERLNDWRFSESPDELMTVPERNTAELVCKVIEDCLAMVDDAPTVHVADINIEAMESYPDPYGYTE